MRTYDCNCNTVSASSAWTHICLLLDFVLLEFVWLIFSNMARKVVDFQGLLLGAFFVPVFGPDLLTCAARVPIFGPTIWDSK